MPPRRSDRFTGRPRAALAAALFSLAAPLAAANASEERAPAAAPGRALVPSTVAVRAESPPVIDGDLSEASWSKAKPIDALFQTDPKPGEPATEKTEVRVLYDGEAIYFGIRCFDSDPGAVVATQMARNASTFLDDRVSILIDTFFDKRNGYLFQISAGGAREDSLVADNGSRVDSDWDGIWRGRTLLVEDGWTAEIAIPTRTVGFRPGGSTWGFNVDRLIRRRVEFARWASPDPNYDFTQVAVAGELGGFEGLEQGFGLDLRPYALTRWTHTDVDDDDDLFLEFGGDAFYRITPALTASLTINTDFAETEVDDRQVNLTRFPLFFPEKRDFFLEDASLFEFGSRSQDLIPFFSRRIGLEADGDEVPILVGGKLAGRAGPMNVGLLDVQTGDHGDTDGQNLAAARVSANVLEQSTIGGIFTRGDPTGETENVLAGFDANYRITDLFGDDNLVARAFGLATHTNGEPGDDLAFGASVEYPNDLFEAALSAKEIQENFDPKLGFVPRRGIRDYELEFGYNPRPGGFVRRVLNQVDAGIVTDVGSDIESSFVSLVPGGLIFDSGDELSANVSYQHERLSEDFEIDDGVVIPPGPYDYVRAGVSMEGGSKRPIVPVLSYEAGEFFDGTRQDLFASAQVKPSRYFFLAPEYSQNVVNLPDGNFTVRVAQLRAVVNFTPDVSWSHFLQYDTDSEVFGYQTRLRWIIEDGRELFVVFNSAFERDGDATSVDYTESELTVKFEYTLRF